MGRHHADDLRTCPLAQARSPPPGITQAGFPVGLLLANLAFLVSVPLGSQWAWRLPFLLSVVLIIVGIMIRLKIDESLKDEGAVAKNPLVEVVRDDWRKCESL